MTTIDLALALVRTTLATSIAATFAWLMLARLNVRSPRVHRLAWLLVIVQGWLLVPWTFRIETSAPKSIESPSNALADAGRGRESFATGELLLIDRGRSQKTPDPHSLAPLAIAAWIIGAAALVGVRLHGYVQLLRSLPQDCLPMQREWRKEWRHLRRSRQAQRTDLRITGATGPLVCWAASVWKYLILAPHSLWAALTSAERQAILRHELAHIERADLWKSLVIRVLVAPQWFNPLARLAVRRFDEAGEWACDEAASGGATGGRLALANSLLRATEYGCQSIAGTHGLRGGVLSRRIERLINPRFKEESNMHRLLVPAMMLVLSSAQLIRVERVAADRPGVAQGAAPCIKPTCTNARDAAAVDPAAPIADPPYIIEPPDVITVDLVSGKPRRGRSDVADLAMFTKGDGNNRFPIAADGKVDLHGLGTVYVAGLTLDAAKKAIEAKLSDHFDDPAVNVSVANYNSKAVYVIFQGLVGGDMVERCALPYPRTADLNVGNYLANSCRAEGFPALEDLAGAIISIRRPAPDGVGPEQVLAVEWDRSLQRPSDGSNHLLQAGDRVFVEFRRGEIGEQETETAGENPSEIPRTEIPVAAPVPGSYYAPAPQSTEPPAGASVVVFDVMIFHDPNNRLAEMDELRNEGSMLVQSERELRTKLRLPNYKNPEGIVSQPKLMTQLGRPAQLKIGERATQNGQDIGHWLDLSLKANRTGVDLAVDCDITHSDAGLRYRAKAERAKVSLGQSLIVRAHGEKASPDAPKVEPLYVLLTPSVPDAEEFKQAKANEVRYGVAPAPSDQR